MAATRSVRELLTRAMRVARILGAGESADANDMSDALLSLNQMLDAWQAERLFTYAVVERTFPLTAGVGTYTVGPAGTINVPRPVRIEYAFTRDAQDYDRSMEIVPEEVYAAITLKNIGNNFPQVLYYEPTYPLGQISLWYLPTSDLTLHFGAWEVLTEYTNLSSIVSVPPGYEDAIVYSMAERLKMEYGGEMPAWLVKTAKDARANIQQNNLADPRVGCEFMGVGSGNMAPYQSYVAGDY